MPLQRMQRVVEFDLIMFVDELSKYFFAQVRWFLFAVEEDDANKLILVLRGDLAHEELEIVNEKFGFEELSLMWRMLPARYFG